MRPVIAIAGRSDSTLAIDFHCSPFLSSFFASCELLCHFDSLHTREGEQRLINGNCRKSDSEAELHCLTSCNNLKTSRLRVLSSSQIGGKSFSFDSEVFHICTYYVERIIQLLTSTLSAEDSNFL